MYKCRECRYLTGEKKSIGIECMNPEKQKKWNAGHSAYCTAKYKYPATPACKKFELQETTR